MGTFGLGFIAVKKKKILLSEKTSIKVSDERSLKYKFFLCLSLGRIEAKITLRYYSSFSYAEYFKLLTVKEPFFFSF